MKQPGASAIAAVAFAIGAYGFAFGVVAAGVGLSWVAVAAMSIFAYSGGAQAAFVGALAVASPMAALTSGLLINLRLAIYGAMAKQALSDHRPGQQLVAVHLASDETIALTNTAPPGAKSRTYWSSGSAFFVVWVATTTGGALVGDAIADPNALGLDAAFPAVFLALLAPLLSTRGARAAALTAAAITLATTPLLPGGLPIVAALVGGVAAAGLVGSNR